ncbi:MAG TPA: hypothetical protein PLR93_09690 [Anaerolineales bacterium]|nr:hypothetical protein [Anaerolineales bacterium]
MAISIVTSIQVEIFGESVSSLLDDTGSRINIENGLACLEVISKEEGFAFGDTSVWDMVLTFATNVSAGVVANAVFSALGHQVRRIVINGRRVRPTREEVEKALEVIQLAMQSASNDKKDDL